MSDVRRLIALSMVPPLAEEVAKQIDGGGGADVVLEELAEPSGAELVGFTQAAEGAIARPSIEKLREVISVDDFGADPSNTAVENTECITKAIAAAGPGGALFFPRYGYNCGPLQVLDGQYWYGIGRDENTLIGDGTGPLIKTNPYGGPYPVRNLHLYCMGLVNTGADTVQLHGCRDSSIQLCTIRASGNSTVTALSQILSVTCRINGNRILASGGAYAWRALDNCNGTDGSNNTVSAGTNVNGKAVEIGSTQTFNIDFLVVEVGGGIGVSIGGNLTEEEGGGSSSFVSMRGAYFEQVRRPIEIGLRYAVFGVDATGSFISNNGTSSVSARDSAIHVGRVKSLLMRGFRAIGTGVEALFEFYDVTDGIGPHAFMEVSDIFSNQVVGYSANFIKNSAFTALRENRIFGKNRIAINSFATIGEERIYYSPVLTANVALSAVMAFEPTAGGGFVTAVDIIDQTGTVACTVSLGGSTAPTEVMNVDPSTLTYVAGYGRAVSQANDRYIRPNEGLRLRLTAGAGTGTFRVRITGRF